MKPGRDKRRVHRNALELSGCRRDSEPTVVMNAANASRSAGGMVRPSFERRHKMSSGKLAHSFA